MEENCVGISYKVPWKCEVSNEEMKWIRKESRECGLEGNE